MEQCSAENLIATELKDVRTLGLANVGTDVKVYRYAQLVKPSAISIGDGSQIDDFAWLHGGQKLEIGKRVHICAFVSIAGGGVTRIGNYAGLSAGVRVVSGTEDPSGRGLTNPCIPPEFRAVKRSSVQIGEHVLVFTNAVILYGLTIGEGAVILPNAVVRKDLQPWGYYSGDPAVRVRDRPSSRILSMAEEMIDKYGY